MNGADNSPNAHTHQVRMQRASTRNRQRGDTYLEGYDLRGRGHALVCSRRPLELNLMTRQCCVCGRHRKVLAKTAGCEQATLRPVDRALTRANVIVEHSESKHPTAIAAMPSPVECFLIITPAPMSSEGERYRLRKYQTPHNTFERHSALSGDTTPAFSNAILSSSSIVRAPGFLQCWCMVGEVS